MVDRKKIKVGEAHKTLVDYETSFTRLITEADLIASRAILRSKFRQTQEIEVEGNINNPVELRLMKFPEFTSLEDATKKIRRFEGGIGLDILGPAGIHELIAFSKSHPNIQLRFPIIAIGSVADSEIGEYFQIPCLRGDNRVRTIGLVRGFQKFGPHCRFLVKKIGEDHLF